jgi:hypothetical protein
VPSAVAAVGALLPLSERDGRWWLQGPASPLQALLGSGDRIGFAAGDLARCRASGRSIRIGRQRLSRCASEARAAQLAEWLRKLAGADASQRREQLRGAFSDALSLDACRAECARFDRATRMLAWLADADAAALLIALPLAIVALGSERSLLYAGPLLALLHVATLVAFGRAHLALLPQERADRINLLASALLYPPALLGGLRDLRLVSFERFHPAALACLWLPEAQRIRFLRSEILQREARAPDEPDGLDALELRALWELADAVGASRQTLLGPPARRDPWARAYCPACHAEYRESGGLCSDCRLPLAAHV